LLEQCSDITAPRQIARLRAKRPFLAYFTSRKDHDERIFRERAQWINCALMQWQRTTNTHTDTVPVSLSRNLRSPLMGKAAVLRRRNTKRGRKMDLLELLPVDRLYLGRYQKQANLILSPFPSSISRNLHSQIMLLESGRKWRFR